MEFFNDLEKINNTEPAVIALGNFDGVHLGHVKLINTAVEEARRRGVRSAVFTFSNHPKNMLPGKHVKNILYQDEKRSIIESLGVDYMFDVPFTEEILKTTAEDFVKNILVKRLKASAVVCGFNYTYGYKAQGTVETLEAAGKKYGFDVLMIEPFKVKGRVVSSSLIRNLITRGKVERCRLYMGRNYETSGIVVHGDKLGRKFGFPTCNIMIDRKMVTPPNGVYVTILHVDGKEYPAVTNVGVKPTVGKYKKNIETNIFDFDGDLYGKYIIVEFLKRLRSEKKFAGIDELKAQMKIDKKEAEAFHKKYAEENK